MLKYPNSIFWRPKSFKNRLEKFWKKIKSWRKSWKKFGARSAPKFFCRPLLTPCVSRQFLAYPPTPPRQPSVFGLPPYPPASASVSFWQTPPPPKVLTSFLNGPLCAFHNYSAIIKTITQVIVGIFCLKSFMGFYAISRYIDDETYVLPRNIVFKLALRGPSYIFKRGVAGIHALHTWLVYSVFMHNISKWSKLVKDFQFKGTLLNNV